MSISSIGAGLGSTHSQLSQIFQQRRKDFHEMSGAVQSGDMSAAQKALAALQQDQADLQSSSQSSDCNCGWGSIGALGGTSNPLSTDMTALIQDVQSGDVTAAQKDLKQLQADRQQMMQKHAEAAPTGASAIQQDTEALIKAIQDGDANTAKQDLAKLRADIKADGPAGRNRHHQQVDADGDGDGDSSTTDATSPDQPVPPNGNPAYMSRLFEALTAYLGQNTSQVSASVTA